MKTLQILDIVYFLVSKYQYEQINLSSNQKEFWLFNAKRERFNLIRLSSESMNDYKMNKDAIMNEAQRLSSLYKIKPSVLSIHFTDEDAVAYFEPDFMQAQVNETVLSPILKDEFKGIEHAIKPATKDLKDELVDRQKMFTDLNQKKVASQKAANRKQRVRNQEMTWTKVIILLNIILYSVRLLIEAKSGQVQSVIVMGAIYKPLIYGSHEWWRIIASGFTHFDFIHILANMWALMQVGHMIEKVYGKKQMLFIYFTSIVTSSLLSLVTSQGSTITAGASGGIFGLIGALTVYLFTSGLYKVPAVRASMIRTITINLMISLLPSISMFGHLGGLVGGVLAAMFVSQAEVLKSAKISSAVSLVFIIVSMFTFSLMGDEKFFPLNPKLDHAMIETYEELGLNKHANKLDLNLKAYYESIGETFK